MVGRRVRRVIGAIAATGVAVDGWCTVEREGPPATVALHLPADGSRRSFDLVAPTSCLHGRNSVSGAFRLTGVAPSLVLPGQSAFLDAEFRTPRLHAWVLSTALQVDVDGGAREVTFSSLGGRVRVPLPVPDSLGRMEIRFRRVQGTGTPFQAPQGNEPRSAPISCSFPDPGEPLLIPDADTPLPTTTTTTTTRPNPSPLCAARPRIPAWLWPVLVKLFHLRCP